MTAASDGTGGRPPLEDAARQLAGNADFRAAFDATGDVAIGSAVGASAAVAIAAAARTVPRHVLAVTADPDDAERLAVDLEACGASVKVFPASGPRPDLLQLRLEAAAAARRGETRVTATPLMALLQALPGTRAVRESLVELAVGAPLEPRALLRRLIERGFERVPLVVRQGEVSLRGDLLDFWPHAADAPLRVEVFEDRIASLRRFEAATQRSIERCERVALPLVREGELDEMDPLDAFPADAAVALVEEGRVAERAHAFEIQGGAVSERLARFVRSSAERGRWLLRPLPGGAFDLGARTVRELGVGLRPTAEVLPALARTGRVVVFCANEGEVKRLRETLKDRGVDDALPIDVRAGELSRGFTILKLAITALTHAELAGVLAVRRPLRPRKVHEARAIEAAADLHPGDLVVHAVHGVGRFLRTEQLRKGAGEEESLVLEFADETKLYVPASRIDLVGKYIGAGRATPPLDKIGGVSFAKRKAQVQRAIADMAAELLETQAARELRTGFACPSDDELQREFEAAFPFVDTEDQVKCTAEIKRDLESPKPMDRLLCGDVGYGKTELAMRAACKVVRAGRQVAVLVPTTVLAEQHRRSFRERFADFPVAVDSLSRFRSAKEVREILRRAAEGTLDVLIGTHRILSKDVQFKDLGLVIIDEEQRFGVRAKERLKKLRATVDVLAMSATPIPRTLHQAMVGLRDISSLTTPPPGREAVETHAADREDDDRIQDAIRSELNRGGQVFFVHNRISSLQARMEHLARLVPEARYAWAHGQMGDDALEEAMTEFVKGDIDVLVSTAIVENGLDIERANTILIDHAEWFGLADLHQLRGRVGRGSEKAYCYLLTPRSAPLNADARARIRAVEEFQQLGSGFDLAMRDLEIRGAGNLLGAQQSGHIAAVGYDLYCRLLKLTVERLRRERQRQLDREARAATELGIQRPALVERSIVKSLSGEDAEPLDLESPPILEGGDAAEPLDEGARGVPVRRAPELQAVDETGVDVELGVRAFLPESYVPDLKLRLDAYRAMDSIRDRASADAVLADLRDRFGRPPEEVRRLADVFLVKNRLRGSGVKLIAYARDRFLVDTTDAGATERVFERGFRDRRYADEGRLHLVFDKERERTPDEALRLLVRALDAPPPVAATRRPIRK